MTRKESYGFLVKHATMMVAYWTRLLTLPPSPHDTPKQQAYHLQEKKDALANWENALDLLTSEQDFHMRLFGKTNEQT